MAGIVERIHRFFILYLLEKRVNHSNEEKQFQKTTEWQGIYLLLKEEL